MQTSLTSPVENVGHSVADDKTTMARHELGQFFTPKHVADFMASLFLARSSEIQLLDAGAGTGALTEALVSRLCGGECRPERIAVTAYEIDGSVIDALDATLRHCQQRSEHAGIQFSYVIHNEDFIGAAVSSLRSDLFSPQSPLFNAAIVNPPYRKLRSDSAARLLLRSIGIETSNFYSAFVALILRLLTDGGDLVAITPRSFCNGPYFTPFRKELLKTASLRRLHLFGSRSAAFGKDDVLQENVIVHAIKGEPQPKEVVLSTSSGRPGSAVSERKVSYQDVVSPNDPEKFIHIGVEDNHAHSKSAVERLGVTLGDLGLTVSTGRVVDFRAKAFLRKQPDSDTVPLVYPLHFKGGVVVWPRVDSKKPNAIVIHDNTRELLVPAGVYVLVKRFSSKEERRRIVACIYDPELVPATFVAFENHLNYFHINGGGLPMTLAKGLAAFLNSTLVDSYFRQFSGHTQVNATDLRKLQYPTKIVLERLGKRIDYPVSQSELDELLEKELF